GGVPPDAIAGHPASVHEEASMKQWLRRWRVRPALAGAVAIALAAWSWPVERGAVSADESASCQFELKASNTLSIDVWVDLYDSAVRREYSLIPLWVQLKIQNHRIRSGESMNRRYTAGGPCHATRNWSIKVRRGGTQR